MAHGDIDLTQKLTNSMAARPRTRGRYSASEVFFILSGKTTPEEWLHPSRRKLPEMFKMWDGSMIHGAVQELLRRGYEEEKREYSDFGITLVGKADYLPDARDGVPNENEVWELKTSDKAMTIAKPWQIHQTKLYCSMFGKEKGKIFQPIRTDSTLGLKLIGEVGRDDVWFMEQINKLYDFHMKVEELWNKGS